MLRRWSLAAAALALLFGGVAAADSDSGGSVGRGGTVERGGAGDGADLEAEDSLPGEGGGGLVDGCGRWRPVSVTDLPGVPPGLVVGLDPAAELVQRTTDAGFGQTLHLRLCPGAFPGTQYRWFDDDPALRDLVLRARDALLLPLPDVRLAPPGDTARTLVGIDTWFWVPGEHWRPIEESVSAGVVTVTATATPLQLRVDPGDGEPVIGCSGPGTPWVSGATSTCAHTYRWVSAHHESGTWPAVVEVVWEITWASSLGQEGLLDPFVMATPVPVLVAEAEVVLRPGGGARS